MVRRRPPAGCRQDSACRYAGPGSAAPGRAPQGRDGVGHSGRNADTGE